LGRVGQTLPHTPQWVALLMVLISQPSVRLSLLQSAKPALQLPLQLPPTHVAVMLLVEQAIPEQPPHCTTEVLVSTSQPLPWRLPSQLARPAEQVPLHTLAPQVRDTSPVPEHTVPQAPQASASAVRLRHTPEQVVCPAPQVVTQAPAEQT
jgi:hypothetical protein